MNELIKKSPILDEIFDLFLSNKIWFILLLALMFLDVFVFNFFSTLFLGFIVFLFLFLIAAIKLSSNSSLIIAVISLVFSFFFDFLNSQSISEKFAVWFYFLTLIGVSRKILLASRRKREIHD